MNRIHTSTLRIDWPCYSLPIMDMCVCGEWGGPVLLLCGGGGGQARLPPAFPYYSAATDCPRQQKHPMLWQTVMQTNICLWSIHAVTGSHSMCVMQDQYLSMKYFVQLSVCMAVYMSVPFCILCMCEQVLFVYVYTIISPRLSDPCNFITVLLVTRDLISSRYPSGSITFYSRRLHGAFSV